MLFKALLFIRAGNIIHSSERFQDIRVIGGSSEILPFSKRIILGSSLSLCGLPFISAFYSKEIIIESLLIKNISFFRYLILILGILITVFYRFRLIFIVFLFLNRQRSLFTKIDLNITINFRIFILLIPAISGGRIINYFIKIDSLFLIPSYLKFLNLFLIILGIFLILFYSKIKIIKFKKKI